VKAIALVQTTYTNPVRTANMAGLFTALERPVIVPLLHLTIWLSPLIWLSNLMSYLNGSAFLSAKSSGFAGTETWEELDFVARFQLQDALGKRRQNVRVIIPPILCPRRMAG